MDFFNRKKNEKATRGSEEKNDDELKQDFSKIIDGLVNKTEIQKIASQISMQYMPDLDKLPAYDEVIKTHFEAAHNEAQATGLNFCEYTMVFMNHASAIFVGAMSSFIRDHLFNRNEQSKEVFAGISPVEVAQSIAAQQLNRISKGIRMEKGEIEMDEKYKAAMEEAKKYAEKVDADRANRVKH